MPEAPDSPGVVTRPTLQCTPEILEQHLPALNLRLLMQATELYGIDPEHVNETQMLVTHQEVLTTHKDRIFPEGRWGSFSVIENTYQDGTKEEFWRISIHLQTILRLSESGYVPALHTIDRDNNVTDLNCSATFVHELGHLAAHAERVERASAVRSKGRGFLGRFMRGALTELDAYAEEKWVQSRTEELLVRHPELRATMFLKGNNQRAA